MELPPPLAISVRMGNTFKSLSIGHEELRANAHHISRSLLESFITKVIKTCTKDTARDSMKIVDKRFACFAGTIMSDRYRKILVDDEPKTVYMKVWGKEQIECIRTTVPNSLEELKAIGRMHLTGVKEVYDILALMGETTGTTGTTGTAAVCKVVDTRTIKDGETLFVRDYFVPQQQEEHK